MISLVFAVQSKVVAGAPGRMSESTVMGKDSMLERARHILENGGGLGLGREKKICIY